MIIQKVMMQEIPYFQQMSSDWESLWQHVFYQALIKCDLENFSDPKPYIRSLVNIYSKNLNQKQVSCSLSSNYEEMDSSDMLYASRLNVREETSSHLQKMTFVARLKDLYLLDTGLYKFLVELQKCQTFKERMQLKKYISETTYEQFCQLSEISNDYKCFSDACRFVVSAINQKALNKGKETIKEVDAITHPNDTDYEQIFGRIFSSEALLLCDGYPTVVNPKTCLSEYADGKIHTGIDYSEDWKLTYDTAHTVLRIDISPLFFWLEEQLRLVEGVDNSVVTWFDSSYSLQLPSGKRLLNISTEAFLNLVHKETVYSLLSNNITTLNTEVSTVIGITDDYIYVQPQRKSYTRLIYRTVYGKTFEFPIKQRHIQSLKKQEKTK